MNKYKKRYQKLNNGNNKNKKLSTSEDGLNKEQDSEFILRSSTYTWQNYCKNCSWMYYLINSTTFITNILFIFLISINGLSWKIIMEGSVQDFINSYGWFFSSIEETTKDLITFYYHPTTVYQMIPIIMGFIFSYIWDVFRVWLDVLTHGVIVVILLYKPLWKKKIIIFYLFHGLCYYLTKDIWGFKLIDYFFSWRYTLIHFCENILAGSINNDKDFLKWFKNNSDSRLRQHETISTYELDNTNTITFSLDDDNTFLTMDNLDTNNIIFTFLTELVNKYSRKFCVVGPISWVWIWILGLKIWYSSWIIENIKEIYIKFRESIEQNIIVHVIHWRYLEKDDTIEKSPISPQNPRLSPIKKTMYQPTSEFTAAKSYILNNNKVAKLKKSNSKSEYKNEVSVKSKDLKLSLKDLKLSSKESKSNNSNSNSSNNKHDNKSTAKSSNNNHNHNIMNRRIIRIKKS